MRDEHLTKALSYEDTYLRREGGGGGRVPDPVSSRNFRKIDPSHPLYSILGITALKGTFQISPID